MSRSGRPEVTPVNWQTLIDHAGGNERFYGAARLAATMGGHCALCPSDAPEGSETVGIWALSLPTVTIKAALCAAHRTLATDHVAARESATPQRAA